MAERKSFSTCFGENLAHLIVIKNTIPRDRSNCGLQTFAWAAVNKAAPLRPPKENLGGYKGMKSLRGRERVDALGYVVRAYLRQSPLPEREVPTEKAPVVPDGAGTVPLLAMGEEERERLVECGSRLIASTQCLLSENPSSLGARIGKRDGGIAADSLAPAAIDQDDEGPCPTLRDAKSEASLACVPIRLRALFRGGKALDGEVSERNLWHRFGTGMLRLAGF